MKITKDFILREIAGDYVLVPVGETALAFNGMITVNETGAFLWNCLRQETDTEQMTEALLGEYDVERGEAKRDVEEFTRLLRKHGILEDEGGQQ